MLKQLALTLALILVPSLAFAGSFVDGTYSSNQGYTIKPPSNWVRLDASTADAMTGHIPLNIAKESVERFDVVFFPAFSKVDMSLNADNERLEKNKAGEKLPPASDVTEPPAFSPNISVIVLNTTIKKVQPEGAKAYENFFVENVKNSASYAKNLKVVESTYVDSLVADAYRFKISYTYDKSDIEIEQTVLFGRKKTIVVTCTKSADDQLGKQWCREVVSSVSI